MTAPRRIVSLCPSITEALFEIGAGDRVVGVTEYCVHPRERVAAIAKVGGSKLADLDAIFRLQPDLVIMNEEENRIEDYEEIQAHGINILNTFPKTPFDAAAMMRDIGRAVGCEAAADRCAREIEDAAARADHEQRGKRRMPAICLIWMRPFMTVNRDTFIHHMMDLGGFDNVFAGGADRYPKLSRDDLAGAREALGAELILLPNEPFEFAPQHATEIAALSGLPTRRAVHCDGQYLSWYGSRTAAGIEYITKLSERARAFPPL